MWCAEPAKKLISVEDFLQNELTGYWWPIRVKLVRIAGSTINTQWQVLQWGAHPSTREPTYTHTQTHIHANTGAQVFLGLAYTLAMCHVSGCLPCQQHTTHTSTKAHNHAAWRQVWRAHEPTRTYTQTLHTVTLLSPGLGCQNEYREAARMCVWVCVSTACVCWQMICLKLTPPTLSQWQQVSTQGPDLCELRRYTVDWEQNNLSWSPFHT